MNIRSLTGFLPLANPIQNSDLCALRDLVSTARTDFAAVDLPMQSARLALPSPKDLAPGDLTRFARDLAAVCKENSVDYISLGAFAGEHPLVQAIPHALAATDNVFASAVIASRDDGINLPAILNAARVIRQLADSTQNGFGNLRFAALANVPPHSPFFPAAYHDGGAPAFALAPEAAPLAVEAFSHATDLAGARANLVGALERAGETMARVANGLSTRFGFRFAGIDFSLAPYPEVSRSIGNATERLLGNRFGEHGTLFAAAFLTDCVNRAQFPRTGFSGLMLPVLEDAILAARTSLYTVHSLLLYSAVCGTGLDTVPLPGDTTVEALAAILLDLATLAVKLDKPLTARLMPIPGLKAGDETHFDFEYFANARVMDAHASALNVFGKDTTVKFVGRRSE
jgi:uncharacterized protein